MQFANISNSLEVFDLNKIQINLSNIQNRRFMYHSAGILVLGAEDTAKSSRGLLQSHAEEYGIAAENVAPSLPPYDAFVRGWIGAGKHYPHGIIHFAPHIVSAFSSSYHTAFDFIEVALKNGFNDQCVLRGFGEVWERLASDVLGESTPLSKKRSLEEQIRSAETRTLEVPARIDEKTSEPLR